MSQTITGKTRLLGVMGHPIAHSLSPVMHNAALQQMGLDYVYVPLPVKPEDLGTAIAGFAAIGLHGLNVTIPHKQAVVPYLASVTDLARAVGAVNTLWYADQGWHGTNTDVAGFLAPLQGMARSWDGAIALVLGNGGAARAVVAGCAQLGFGEIWVIGRNPDKLTAFHQSWAEFPGKLPLQVFSWEKLSHLLPPATLVVNTTPIGMAPHIDQSPLSPNELEGLSSATIAYDLIYTPSPTQFLHQAKARGAETIDGLEMLVQQGAVALELWLGQPVPVDTMRQSLRQRLMIKTE